MTVRDEVKETSRFVFMMEIFTWETSQVASINGNQFSCLRVTEDWISSQPLVFSWKVIRPDIYQWMEDLMGYLDEWEASVSSHTWFNKDKRSEFTLVKGHCWDYELPVSFPFYITLDVTYVCTFQLLFRQVIDRNASLFVHLARCKSFLESAYMPGPTGAILWRRGGPLTTRTSKSFQTVNWTIAGKLTRG